MSPWGFAAGWLVVAGTTLLTIGTGAQASANLARYKSSQETVSIAVGQTRLGRYAAAMPAVTWVFPFGLAPILVRNLRLVLTPSKLAEIRKEGGEGAVELAEYLRSATAWGVLMAGSVLVLAATVIQLVLAYQ